MNREKILQFLNDVRGQPGGPGFIAFINERKKERALKQMPARCNDYMIGCLMKGRNVGRYFTPANYHTLDGRAAKNVDNLNCLFVDMDAGPAKPYATADEAREGAFDFAADIDMPISYLIGTGGGVHVYWVFDEPAEVREWKPLALGLKSECRKRDLNADDAVTADAARYLRIPGSSNYKLEEKRPCEILYPKRIDNTVVRHSYDALAERLVSTKPAEQKSTVTTPGTPENIQKVESALSAIDPDAEYPLWRDLLFAVHSTGWVEAKRLAQAWSEKGEKWDAEVFARTWAAAKVDGGIELATVFYHAVRAGWVPPVSDSELSLFTRNANGAIRPTAANVDTMLKTDPALSGLIHFDTFAHRREIQGPLDVKSEGGLKNGYPRAWSDSDSVRLLTYIQKSKIPNCTKNCVEEALLLADQDNAYSSIQNYLNSLTWDGEPRIDTWLIEYLDAEDCGHPEYLEAVGSCWLINAVARAFAPGCKADHMLVLEGRQNLGKSEALRILASDSWFSDSLPRDLSHKDAMQHLQGKWICEMSELSQMKRSDVESMKSFVSRRVDKFRPPYHRNEPEFPRQTVLAGTSNDDSYLIDVTGNWRYWCVQCAHIDLKRLKKDRDQLWAEATHAYNHGAQWHITDTEIYGVITEIQERRTITDPWYSDVLDELAKIDPESGISPGEMLRRLEVDPMHQHKGSAARCGQMLRNAGWTKGPRDRKRGNVYYPPRSRA